MCKSKINSVFMVRERERGGLKEQDQRQEEGGGMVDGGGWVSILKREVCNVEL